MLGSVTEWVTMVMEVVNNTEVADGENSTAPEDADGVTRVLSLYVTATFIAIGMLGNVVSVLLLLCTKLKYQSCSHYVTAAIVANTFCLFAACLKWAAIMDLQLYNSAGWCQFVSFIENTCVFLSVWCTVGLAVDRYVTICWSTRARKLCTTFRAKSIIVALALVGTVVYMNISLVMGVVTEDGIPRCTPLPDYFFNMKLLRTVDIAVNFVVPYTAILLFVCCMCRYACEISRDDDGTSDDSQLGKMASVFLILFLVLRMPREVLRLTHTPHYGLVETNVTEPAVVAYSKATADQLYLASLSLHFFVLLFTHRGFVFFLKKALLAPVTCFVHRRHLMVQTQDDDMALDNLPTTTRVYV